jgi:hypothetical protein
MGALKSAKDFHPLYRIDPQIGFDVEIQIEHFRRIPCAFTDDLEELARNL